MDHLDLATFWKSSDYARRKYVGAPVTDEMIQAVQAELGCRLPAAYVELLRSQNGGVPVRTRHRASQPTSWAEDHVALTGIFGLDRRKLSSLCGEFGSRFWTDMWEYPAIGVYFADCPSAGHDMLCLDYRMCGPEGEPAVVHVDHTPLADNFEAFLRGLEDGSAFG